MLSLATAVLSQPPGQVFLIDEPQAYLHPHAERSLLELIDAHCEHQYVIATHSHVLLNACPLHQVRLVSLDEAGASSIAAVDERQAMLESLGLRAGDIGLAEHVLWVEGPTEEEVLSALLEQELSGARRGIAVRRMPEGVSRFATTKEKKAKAAYSFLHELTDAVAPLPIEMSFLFDRNDKGEQQRARIDAASGRRAHFLAVREIENFFLDGRLIASALAVRAKETGQPAPGVAQVEENLDQLLAETSDSQLFPAGAPGANTARADIKGSEVLKRLFGKLLLREYDKVRDARLLAELADREILAPLAELVDQALAQAPGSRP